MRFPAAAGPAMTMLDQFMVRCGRLAASKLPPFRQPATPRPTFFCPDRNKPVNQS
jgi:hypothetical protein